MKTFFTVYYSLSIISSHQLTGNTNIAIAPTRLSIWHIQPPNK